MPHNSYKEPPMSREMKKLLEERKLSVVPVEAVELLRLSISSSSSIIGGVIFIILGSPSSKELDSSGLLSGVLKTEDSVTSRLNKSFPTAETALGFSKRALSFILVAECSVISMPNCRFAA